MNGNYIKKFALLSLLLCAGLTACRSKEPPAEEQPPPAALSLYCLSGEGTRDLACGGQWEVYIEERQPERFGEGYTGSTGVLLCSNLETGEVQVLDELLYGSEHSYWGSVQLYPFSGILGCDGFIFEHGIGAGYEAFDFYTFDDAGPVRIAECYNTLYTADLNGDGCLELLSSYSIGYLDVFQAGDSGMIQSYSLNHAAQELLDLDTDKISWVSLHIDSDTGSVAARWQYSGQEPEESTVDPAALLEIEKNRPVTEESQ